MEYPGNAALPEDIKERIVLTFQQTLESVREGKGNEALLGCDFILKLDPDFQPARDLTKELQESSAPSPGAGPQIEALVRSRRFKEALDVGRANSALVAGDPAIAELLSRAQELAEASPYVSSFLDSAKEAMAAGDGERAEALLDKARVLDPEHPRLRALSEELARATGVVGQPTSREPGASPASSSAFSLDFDEPVTSFRLDGSAADAAPLNTFPADTIDPDDDPLASLGQEPAAESTHPSGSFPDSAEIPDPFADLSASVEGGDDPLSADFLDAAAPPAGDGGVGDGAIDDFELTDDDLAPDEVEGDPFDLLTAEDESPGAPPEVPPDDLDLLGHPGKPDTGPTADAGGSGDRVKDLLDDGQAAFDRGDPQGAIDAWSRIFLIDIDNQEASRRIERARKLKAESERAVEEVFHEGLDAWQAGDRDKAQAAFEKVLNLQPGHAAAAEQLDQLRAGGESPGPVALGEISLGEDPLGGGAGEGPGLSSLSSPSTDDLLEEILVPPAPGETAPASLGPSRSSVEPMAKARSSKSSGSRYLILGLAVLVAVLAGGWYLFSNRSSLFPNNESEEAAGPGAPRLTPIQRAEKLQADGKAEQAIAQLQRVPATSPHHGRARELIAEWSRVEPEPEPTLAPEQVARRQRLMAEALARAESGEYLWVRDLLRAAAKIAPLNEQEEALQATAADHLQPLEKVFKLMEDREWTFALKDLWRQRAEDPENRDALRLLVDCYYNLGVRELQRGDQQEAIDNFQEAVKLNPGDPELARHLDFSQAYLERPEDLLYRIYVKYLPYRTT